MLLVDNNHNRKQNIQPHYAGRTFFISLYNCPASVLLWDRINVGLLTFAITFEIVKVFPVPVALIGSVLFLPFQFQ